MDLVSQTHGICTGTFGEKYLRVLLRVSVEVKHEAKQLLLAMQSTHLTDVEQRADKESIPFLLLMESE
jgi:hypothetical protein